MGLLPAATFLVAAAIAAALYSWIVWHLYSLSEVQAVTVVQLAAAIGYGIVYSIWVGAEAGFFAARLQPRYESIHSAVNRSHGFGRAWYSTCSHQWSHQSKCVA